MECQAERLSVAPRILKHRMDLKIIHSLIFVLWMGICCIPSFTQDAKLKPLPEIVDTYGKAVGLVATLDVDGSYIEKFSCFFVDPSGILVTAYQPLADAESIEVLLPDGRKFRDVSVVSVDPRKDIAILKIPATALPVVTLGDSDRTRVGETLVVLSRPLGTFISATDSLVAAIRDSKRGLRLHQLADPVNRSATGGPALNDRGETVGMVSFYRLFNESLGFLVPINYVRGLMGEKTGTPFAEFVKTRKPFQPFDPALVEAKRLAIIEKVRVNNFDMRDRRVKWEQINTVTSKLQAELIKELNAYGTTSAEIFLADPFEVAEHRRLISNLSFGFNEIFVVGEGQDDVLIPLTPGLMNSVPPGPLDIGHQLYGKKGESKGKISKVQISYSISTYLPLFLQTTTNLTTAIELAGLLSRLESTEDMPRLSLAVFYKDPSDGKDKEAESIWSFDAYTVPWSELKNQKMWDLQAKLRSWKQMTRDAKKQKEKEKETAE
ncbi:MAG: trypsin-like peptidase domain-containing protein [Acidobacteriia bacterium]|nr:trypsin-like peptidase domain-containing protein [Terriglobia bacterium]